MEGDKMKKDGIISYAYDSIIIMQLCWTKLLTPIAPINNHLPSFPSLPPELPNQGARVPRSYQMTKVPRT